MPNDAAVAELDTDKLSDQLAGDLGTDFGLGNDSQPGLDDAIDSADADSVPGGQDSQPGGQTRGADGKFAKAAAAAPAAPGAPAADTPLPVPQSWKKEMHPHWEKLPREVQAYYNEREKQMLEGLTGYKTDAEYGKSLRAVAAQHEGLLRQQGLDVPKAVGYLLNAHAELSLGTKEQKVAYLGKIAKQYGIDLAQPAADPNAPQLPPEVKALQDQVSHLTATMTEREQREYKAIQEKTMKEVDAFAADPKNPYFEECADHICSLLKANPSTTLAQAYEAAVWANPVTRQKELARLQKEREEEDRKKTEAAVKAAKKGTSTNVRGRDTTRAPQAPAATLDKLDDVMRETHEEIRSRTD